MRSAGWSEAEKPAARMRRAIWLLDLLRRTDLFDGNANPLGDAFSIGRIGAEEVTELPLLDVARSMRKAAADVADQPLFFVQLHQTEEVTGLRVVVGLIAMVLSLDSCG